MWSEITKTQKANFIKAVVANYWHRERKCPLVACEVGAKLRYDHTGDRADVLVLTGNGYLLEVEVKTSIEDMRCDIHKEIHGDLEKEKFNKYPVHFFFFAVLPELEKQALEIIESEFPHAGLLVVTVDHFNRASLRIARRAKHFVRPKLGAGHVRQLMNRLSSAVCKMLYEQSKDAFQEFKNLG